MLAINRSAVGPVCAQGAAAAIVMQGGGRGARNAAVWSRRSGAAVARADGDWGRHQSVLISNITEQMKNSDRLGRSQVDHRVPPRPPLPPRLS